jgi:hypothetical protein
MFKQTTSLRNSTLLLAQRQSRSRRVKRTTRHRTKPHPANAITAAIIVETKFTALLPRNFLRSTVAPSILSATVPAIAATAQRPASTRVILPDAVAVRATTIAATTPANVPEAVTAPSVPTGTCVQVVTRRGTPPNACPTSLDTVSAAASARAATAASNKRESCQPRAKAAAHSDAIPTFASTCRPFLRASGSAAPSFCLWAYPNRVVPQVSRKTTHRAANPPQPAPSSSAKQTAAPASAPSAVTPPTNHPNAEKTTVTAAFRGQLAIYATCRTVEKAAK